LATEGIDAAMNALRKMKPDPATYILWEDDFNSLAYDLMGDTNDLHLPEQHKYAEALQVFKLNTGQFPTSSNAFDSYAEALQKNGQKAEAIKMYKEAMRLNPKNEHAQQTLGELQREVVQK
jgi:tetratricopeptide (TPR) repeat protein